MKSVLDAGTFPKSSFQKVGQYRQVCVLLYASYNKWKMCQKCGRNLKEKFFLLRKSKGKEKNPKIYPFLREILLWTCFADKRILVLYPKITGLFLTEKARRGVLWEGRRPFVFAIIRGEAERAHPAPTSDMRCLSWDIRYC